MYNGKFMCLCLVLLCKVITETYLYSIVCGIDRDSVISKEVALLHHQFWRAKTTDVEDCARICVKRKLCKSFNFDTSTRQCELNDDVYGTGKEIRSGENLIYSNIAQWPAELEPNCFHRPCGFDEICIPGHLTGNAECSYSCLKLVPTSTQLSSAPHVVWTPEQSTQATSSASQGPTKDSPATSTPSEKPGPLSYPTVILDDETVSTPAPSTLSTSTTGQVTTKDSPVTNPPAQVTGPQSYPTVLPADETVSTPAPSTLSTPTTSQVTTKDSPLTNTPAHVTVPRSYPTVFPADETETNKTTPTCGDPPTILNGWFKIAEGSAYVQCDNGFKPKGERIITCSTTGEWSSISVICKSDPFAGTQFVTVFPRVATGGNDNILFRQIFITSLGQAKVWIKSEFQNLHRTVEMNQFNVQNFSSSYTLTEDRTTNNKVIEIKSDSPINVHTLSYKNGSAQIACDSFYNLPENRLRKEYILITTDVTPQFSVIGTKDDTNVEIQLTNHDSFLHRKLNRFQVFNFFIENNINSFNDNDLTGSVLASNKALAVISGGFFDEIPSGTELTRDMSAEQLPGVSDWSSSCIMAPFIPRRGFQYKIVASENDTSVDVITNNRSTTVNLNRAEKIKRLHNEESPVLVNATKPILVAMFSYGQEKQSGKVGDSSMILCQYPDRYLNSYAFSVPANFDHYVRIIIQDNYRSYLRLNKMPLTPFRELSITAPTGIRYAVIYINVDEMKYYTLESRNGARFGADMYGLTRATQYTHRLGYFYN